MSTTPKVHEAYEPDVTPGHTHGQSFVTDQFPVATEPLGELFIDEDGHRRYVQPNTDGTPVKLAVADSLG